MGEIMWGSVKRIMAMMLEAPLISSMVVSILRKAGVSSMTLMEILFAIRCAQTMPGTLKILNGESLIKGSFSNPMLMSPMSGSSSVIQAMVVAMPGIMKETQNRSSRERLNGMFVRASTQETPTAMGKLIPTTNAHIMMLLPREETRPGVDQASHQCVSPHSRSPANQSGRASKLLMTSRSRGHIR